MMPLFFKNIFLFDFLNKFNLQSSRSLPTTLKAVLSISDRNLKRDVEQASLTFLNALPFSHQLPKFTFIKHQSAGFKTRKGDLAGLKLSLPSSASFDPFFIVFALLAPELIQIGLSPGLGVNDFGAFSLSAPNLKVLPFFFTVGGFGSSVPVGFDISFKFNQKLSREKTRSILSAFAFLDFYALE
jgi:ribosomal protein L5